MQALQELSPAAIRGGRNGIQDKNSKLAERVEANADLFSAYLVTSI